MAKYVTKKSMGNPRWRERRMGSGEGTYDSSHTLSSCVKHYEETLFGMSKKFKMTRGCLEYIPYQKCMPPRRKLKISHRVYGNSRFDSTNYTNKYIKEP